MNWEFWAAIIVAVITALGTIVATNYNDLTMMLRRPSRSVAGVWEVKSYRTDARPSGEQQRNWVGDYTLTLRQIGCRVTGQMTAIKVREGMKPLKYKWTGEVIGDYLAYHCAAATHPNPFVVSNAMLTISPLGDQMAGYFVSNIGFENLEERVFVGFTELHKTM